MKISITVYHVISIDPTFAALLKTIFPDPAILSSLDSDIKNKTNELAQAVQTNTPTV